MGETVMAETAMQDRQTLEDRYADLLERRRRLRLEHAQAVVSLLAERSDLRGVHALADHVDDAVRWTA